MTDQSQGQEAGPAIVRGTGKPAGVGVRPTRTKRSGTDKPSFLRRILAWQETMPGADIYWLLAYAALFLLRPWEIRPELAALPMEKIFALALLVKVFFFGKVEFRPRGPGLAMFVFLGALLVTMFLGLDRGQSWPLVEMVLKVAVFAVCVIVAVRSVADLRVFLLGWVALQFIYQSKAIWEFYVHGRGSYQMGIWRMRGIETTFGHPNTFCATTVLILPLAIALFRYEKNRWVRAFLLAEIAAAVIVIFKTGSRAGLLELVLLALIVLVTSSHRVKGFVALAVLVPVLFFTLPDDLQQRYRTIFDQKANKSATESAQGRVEGLRKGAKLFVKRPLAGVGPNCFVIADARYPGLTLFAGLQPHNLVGQLLGEMGLLGILAFGCMGLATFLALLRIRRMGKEKDDPVLMAFGFGGILVLMFLFVAGTFGHNLYRYNWLWLTALAAAALNAAEQLYPSGKSKGRRKKVKVFTVPLDPPVPLKSPVPQIKSS